MAFFKDFSTALKDKWLQYYQANREWLVLQMDLNSIPTPDGGRRPASSLILGTINALDPEAAQLMLPFSKLNPDPEKLIEVLGLHFDPDLALGVRSTSEQPATVVVSSPNFCSRCPGLLPLTRNTYFRSSGCPWISSSGTSRNGGFRWGHHPGTKTPCCGCCGRRCGGGCGCGWGCGDGGNPG